MTVVSIVFSRDRIHWTLSLSTFLDIPTVSKKSAMRYHKASKNVLKIKQLNITEGTEFMNISVLDLLNG
jgi:hypothetical protein